MVDDDEGLCELVQEFLGREGYRVTAVHDGASGLGAALDGGFALVILDVMLPVLDGFAVLRQLRRQSSVVVSARAPTTTWSSHSRLPSYSPEFAQCCVGRFNGRIWCPVWCRSAICESMHSTVLLPIAVCQSS